MLRRITSSLIAISFLFVSLAPLTGAFAAGAADRQQSRREQKRESKVAPELSEKAASTQMVRVIVQTKGRPTAAHDGAVAGKGGAKRQTFAALDAITVDVPANAVAELAAREDVAYVSPDREVRAELDVTRETTGAAQAQAAVKGVPGLTGKGVGIAILQRHRAIIPTFREQPQVAFFPPSTSRGAAARALTATASASPTASSSQTASW